VSLNVGVLVSGAGTNLQAILDRLHGRHGIEVVAVATDQPGAPALERAARVGVPTAEFPLAAPQPDRPDHPDRRARDAAIADYLTTHRTELVVLAGYMALLSREFVARFPLRVINVHPALLPAFPGVRAIEQALAYGVKVFGVTVHFVDEGVDTGPVIAQRAIELPDATAPTEVREALRPLEHDLLCDAVANIARGAVRLDPAHPRRVLVDR
jgi:phosphoribosylglycinamide formyltransferase 1